MVQPLQFVMILRGLLIGVLALAGFRCVAGEAITPVDVRPHLGKNQFQSINAEWLLPMGQQMVQGVPFHLYGVLEISGTSSRFANPGRSNINEIKINRSFQHLHLLLAASRGSVPSGTAFAEVHLHYQDGTEAALNLEYDRHARDWFGPRHREERPLLDPSARVVWQAQHAEAAKRDDEIRLFYVSFSNPNAAKEVRSLSLRSLRKRPGLIVAAMSVGGAAPGEGSSRLIPRNPHTHAAKGSSEKEPLTGKVADPAGNPIANAFLRIVGLRPPGTNELEFSTTDSLIGAEQRTDTTGAFRFEDTLASSTYKLFIAATNHQPQVYEGADPLCGPLEIRLLPAKDRTATNLWFVHARVADTNDKPLVGASVQIDGVGTDDSTSWGGRHGFENTITDLNGEFIMARTNRFTRLSVDIRAPGFAPANNVWLAEKKDLQKIKMGVGARLTGRVLHEGKPLAGIKVGVAGTDRNSEVFAGSYEAVTDEDGRFEFKNLPPDTQWWFYGHMNSLKKYGELAPRPHQSGDHGSVSDLGELTLSRGLRLAGVVQTKSGESVPIGLKLRAGYETAWDSQEATVRKDGFFQFEGLHSGLTEISLSDSQWKLTTKNRSLSVYNAWYLEGLLPGDKTNLVLQIEPGRRQYRNVSSSNGSLPPQDDPRTLPLSGIESDGSVPLRITGEIVDAGTGKPVAKARIIKGRKPPVTTPAPPASLLETLTKPFKKAVVPWNERPFWFYYHEEEIKDGKFDLEFRRLTSTPLVRVEAEGYQDEELGPFPNSTNLLIRLQRGGGPRGVVLKPDGTAAANARVIYGAEGEQYSLSREGALDRYGSDKYIQTTKEKGEFTFENRKTGKMLFVSHETGWAAMPAEDYLHGGKLQLQAWAVVKGTLVTSNGPAAGEKVALSMPHDWRLQEPFVNIQERPTTDAKGNFTFLRAPPGELELYRLVPMGTPGSGHSMHLQTPIYSKPGETNNLGKVMMDTPPPPPIWKEWKRKLGL